MGENKSPVSQHSGGGETDSNLPLAGGEIRDVPLGAEGITGGHHGDCRVVLCGLGCHHNMPWGSFNSRSPFLKGLEAISLRSRGH